ncbi:MAG: diguanylate cyclase [Acidobacteria bacterium]|nr:diguanylate cyclase [Acidobacteriota bacterium]
MRNRDRDSREQDGRRPLSSLPPPPVTDQRAAHAGFVVDATGTVLAFDRGMERLTGWTAYEVLGRSKDLGIYDEPDENGFRRYVARPIYEGRIPPVGRSAITRMVLLARDGARIEVEALISPLGGGGRSSVEIQQVFARSIVPAPAASSNDPLASMPGDALLQSRLAAAFEAARRAGHTLSLLLLELDDYAALAERAGSAIANEILSRAAAVVQACVRKDDLLVRLEGGALALLLEQTGRGDARAVGGRIRQAIERASLVTSPAGTEICATVSIGAACYPADGESPEELRHRAEEALGEAQRLGRNRVWCYVRRPRVTVETPVYFDGPMVQLLGVSRDVSNSGIFVETRDELPCGTRVPLSFRLPGQPEPVHVLGRVTRRIAAGGNLSDAPGLGIEFEHYSDADRLRLETFLHQSRAVD